MAVPSCFYPSDFGYRLSDVHSVDTGLTGTLDLQSKGGAYGADVKKLTVDMMMESETRVHVKVGICLHLVDRHRDFSDSKPCCLEHQL